MGENFSAFVREGRLVLRFDSCGLSSIRCGIVLTTSWRACVSAVLLSLAMFRSIRISAEDSRHTKRARRCLSPTAPGPKVRGRPQMRTAVCGHPHLDNAGNLDEIVRVGLEHLGLPLRSARVCVACVRLCARKVHVALLFRGP